MQKPLKVNKIFFLWHQAWPQNDLLLLKTKTLKLRFCKVHLIFILLALKMLKTPNFDVTFFKKIRSFLIILFMHDLSTSQFHCNLFWFLTIFTFVDLGKLGILTYRGHPFFMDLTEFVSCVKFFDLIGNCAFGDLSNDRVINSVNNPRVRITYLP